jgi:hypothetical protein
MRERLPASEAETLKSVDLTLPSDITDATDREFLALEAVTAALLQVSGNSSLTPTPGLLSIEGGGDTALPPLPPVPGSLVEAFFRVLLADAPLIPISTATILLKRLLRASIRAERPAQEVVDIAEEEVSVDFPLSLTSIV